MKIGTIDVDGQPHAAAWADDSLALLGAAGDDAGALIRRGLKTADLAAMARAATRRIPPREARLLAPVTRPGKTVCVGLNYADHTRESRIEQPPHPTLFLRTATSLAAHGSVVRRPAGDDSLDFEGEMVVVIGEGGRAIARGDALRHVFGYSIGNDISVREFQFRTPQWALGKNVDGTGLALQTRLNGQVVQSANTRDMLFDVATIIAAVSQAMTLEPGDLIFSGTPAGVGLGRTPRLYMQPGHVVEVEIERLGVLGNRIAGDG